MDLTLMRCIEPDAANRPRCYHSPRAPFAEVPDAAGKGIQWGAVVRYKWNDTSINRKKLNKNSPCSCSSNDPATAPAAAATPPSYLHCRGLWTLTILMLKKRKNGCEIFGRGKKTNRTITKHLLEPASCCPHQHPLPLVGQLHSETMINVMVNEKKTHLHGHHPLQHRLAERGGFCFYWLLALGVVIVYFCVCDVGRYSMVVACYAARHLFETIIFGALYLNFVR